MTGAHVASAPQAACAASWAHFVFVRLVLDLEPDDAGLPAGAARDPHREDWLAVCRRLTVRVERRSSRSAVLDLGSCTAAEALDAVHGLLARLAHLGMRARAGIGPSGCLAELALLRAPTQVHGHGQMSHGSLQRIAIAPTDAAALLHTIPVTLLPQLSCAASAVTPAIVERLHRYGLRTLGHLARLGELTLHRQFGTPVGSVLGAVAVGRDPHPLSPTPPAARLCARLRFPSDTGDAEPEQVLAMLPAFTERIAVQLVEMERTARTLHLIVCWERGGRHQITQTFRQHTQDARLLLAELRRVLVPLLQPGALAASLTELRLTLLDFAPATPEQQTFWRVRAQRLRALDGMADTLTRRHGRPLLLSPRLLTPDAVFHEERYTLTPGYSAATSTAATPSLADTQPSWQPPPHADVRDTRDGQPDAGPDALPDIPHRLHWW